ncbi:hypothetical protein BRADI_4g13587v3 [Brachypodium distachyon]|uniref:Reverse transcriptase zinc-binding domain-containing protein n=1 Tax=Brachypodium distachyon TaxID=15368 RepID=A0A2K2CMM3_BRADI|nr:hypothetical protein BRADI_4g13587v3 [Brachypodium distachyon]
MSCREVLGQIALLARQAWRILHDPSSLSARVLKAKYFPDSELLEADLGSSPSHGLIKRIGSGKETRIWWDNWLPRDSLLRPVGRKSANPPKLVSDLINADRCWDVAKLNEHFFPMDVDVIMNIPLGTTTRSDFWAWHFEKTGVFSVRSAYRMLAHTRSRREDWIEHRAGASDVVGLQKKWNLLWKMHVPAKLKVFTRRLAKNSIPTDAVRFRRNMAQSSICQICHAAKDTWRHALIDCTMAKCIWALLDEQEVSESVDHFCIYSAILGGSFSNGSCH